MTLKSQERERVRIAAGETRQERIKWATWVQDPVRAYKTLGCLARTLNGMKVPTPKGRLWAEGGVLRLLHTCLTCGKVRYCHCPRPTFEQIRNRSK